jgi:uncharacterized membrane protein
LRGSALIASLSQPPVHVLVAGESWIRHTIHMKGFDQFHPTEYEEGGGAVLAALASSGVAVTYIRAHEISARFPKKAEELDRFDTVVARQGENSIFVYCELLVSVTTWAASDGVGARCDGAPLREVPA